MPQVILISVKKHAEPQILPVLARRRSSGRAGQFRQNITNDNCTDCAPGWYTPVAGGLLFEGGMFVSVSVSVCVCVCLCLCPCLCLCLSLSQCVSVRAYLAFLYDSLQEGKLVRLRLRLLGLWAQGQGLPTVFQHTLHSKGYTVFRF